MLGKLLGLSGSASFHLPGWNTRPNLMCRNLGAMGNYSTCSNDSSFANISSVGGKAISVLSTGKVVYKSGKKTDVIKASGISAAIFKVER